MKTRAILSFVFLAVIAILVSSVVMRAMVDNQISTIDDMQDDEPLSHNPFAGPVPDGALMRFGKGEVSRIVISPVEDALIVSNSVGTYYYRLDDLSLISASVVDPWLRKKVISPDGEILASRPSDTIVILWDARSREQLATLKGHTAKVFRVEFSPDSEILATGSWDDTVILWDARSGERLATLEGHKQFVMSLAFSPDGKTLASGSDDTVILWDAHSGERLATFEGHTDFVFSVAFSPDGKTLATGSADNTVKLWDVHKRKRLATLKGHSSGVSRVAFSPDGKILASGSWDGTILIWDVGATIPD